MTGSSHFAKQRQRAQAQADRETQERSDRQLAIRKQRDAERRAPLLEQREADREAERKAGADARWSAAAAATPLGFPVVPPCGTCVECGRTRDDKGNVCDDCVARELTTTRGCVRDGTVTGPVYGLPEAGTGPELTLDLCECGELATRPDPHNPDGEDVPLELCAECYASELERLQDAAGITELDEP